MALFPLIRLHLPKILLICLIGITSRLSAHEVPLLVIWQSQNSIKYDANQSQKEYAWDQSYRAQIDIDDLRLRDAILNLSMDTMELFTEPRLRLRELSIGCKLDDWLIEAGSREHGYGGTFVIDNLANLNYDSERYYFKSIRLNYLNISHIKPMSITGIDIGGNIHNQASLRVSHKQSIKPATLTLSQDFRAKDSQRRYPVSISSIDLAIHPQSLGYSSKNTALFAYHPLWNSIESEQEFYLQSEHSFRLMPGSFLHAGLSYANRLHAPSKIQRVSAAYQQDIRSFSFITMAELSTIETHDIWQYRLALNHHLSEDSSLGLLYEHSRYQSSDSRHRLALLLDFRFDLTN